MCLLGYFSLKLKKVESSFCLHSGAGFLANMIKLDKRLEGMFRRRFLVEMAVVRCNVMCTQSGLVLRKMLITEKDNDAEGN